jgi:hypothetical protein
VAFLREEVRVIRQEGVPEFLHRDWQHEGVIDLLELVEEFDLIHQVNQI